MLFPLWLVLTTAAQSSTATPFRTAVNPRIDPVFGDVTALRRTVDRFLALQAEMDQVRNEFSTAVHSTLAEVTRPAGNRESHAAKICPASAAALYGRAWPPEAATWPLGARWSHASARFAAPTSWATHPG